MVTIDQFARVAAAVSDRSAQLLCAGVAVVDAHGRVVASSDPKVVGSGPKVVGLSIGVISREPRSTYLRIPICLEAEDIEVVISTPIDGESISPRLAQVVIELVVNQMTILESLPNQHEFKNKLIRDLLFGYTSDEADILREGQILGMDFTRPRAVILIDAADYVLPKGADESEGEHRSMHDREAHIQRQAQLIIASIVSFFRLRTDTICAYIGDGEIAVLKASTTQDLEAWTDCKDGMEQISPSWANLTALKRASAGLLSRLRSDIQGEITLGIGRYHPGLKGLACSYQDARAALSLGRRFHGRGQMHCLDGLGIAAFIGLSDEQTKIDLARHLLSPLDHEPDLLYTLDAFFAEDCCQSSTAKRLCLHRNTLSYRLDKVMSYTGLDPRRFDNAMQIRLALALRSLYIAA